MIFDLIYWFMGGWCPAGEDLGMILFRIVDAIFGIEWAERLFT